MNKTHGMDSYYKDLTLQELTAFQNAIDSVELEARNNYHKRPKMTTLLEEFSELVLSFRGKHGDPPSLELKQVASVAINILWQLDLGYDVNNIVTIRDHNE